MVFFRMVLAVFFHSNLPPLTSRFRIITCVALKVKYCELPGPFFCSLKESKTVNALDLRLYDVAVHYICWFFVNFLAFLLST